MSSADAILAQSLIAQSRAAPEVHAGRGPDKARQTAGEFEQFFLAQMLEYMFSGVPTDGAFGGGHAEGIYRSLLNTEYAKVISQGGGIGIADVVYREILMLQESASQ